MEINNEQLQELIAYLQGSCKSLDEACQDMFEQDSGDCLTTEQLEEIDQEIFNCTQCGWWFELAEESESEDGEMICNGCADE